MDRHIPRLWLFLILGGLFGIILFITHIASLADLNDLTATFYKIHSTIHFAMKPPEILWPMKGNHTYCAQFGQKPTAEEAKEERDLLNLISWPGPFAQGLPVEFSSDPAKSYFVIQGPAVQYEGAQLVVNVHMQNFLGLPKKHGGDLLIARLHSPNLRAGVAGKVHDHHNGNYTVLFPLLWAGVVWVEIIMVHPSEAVVVLKRLQKEEPDRGLFLSLFRSGAHSETTLCNLCLSRKQKPLCNYTDPVTGEPWYCYKPKLLSCDTRVTHVRETMKKVQISKYDKQFFRSGVNIKVPIHSSGRRKLTVVPAKKGQTQVETNHSIAGYYYNNFWRPLNNKNMRQFANSSAITRCLKGKIVYMFGDSTMRQYFEYLTEFVPNLKQINLYSPEKTGPFMAVDIQNNIMVTYRSHGPPIYYGTLYSSELRYVSNELDRIEGGPNTVVLVSVGAHFNIFPIEIYIRRLRHIRKAVVQLLKREPATLVVIRSLNFRKLGLQTSLTYSDWFSLQQDIVLRAMFRGIPVHLLDALAMTLAHYLPHDIHPPLPIIKHMIDLVLSHVCPVGGNNV